jgi:hypothetical protein
MRDIKGRERSSADLRALGALLAFLVGIVVLVSLAGGCSSDTAGAEGAWEHEIVEGDGVRTVRTLGGSVWGGEARLEEEASIGVAEGPDEYLLGSVRSICLDGGKVYVLDADVPAVRVYDASGRHLSDIGRKGSGPGEFDRPSSVRVSPTDGRLYVRDGSQGRLNVFAADGSYLETWSLISGISTSRQMVVTPQGELYSSVFLPSDDPDEFFKIAMRRMGPREAEGDTIRFPEFDFQEWRIEASSEGSVAINSVPFSPQVQTTFLPSRAVVGGVSTDYRFEVRHPDGRRTVVVKASWDRVPVDPAESRWYRDRATANMRGILPGWAWNGPEIPGFKPPFDSFFGDRQGRIWVWCEKAGMPLEGCDPDPEESSRFYSHPCWRQDWRLEVFDEEGRFLGPVALPAGLEDYPEPYIDGDRMVAVVTGEDGVPRVKVYRIILP